MTAIKFKKQFYPLIRDGIKTQTLRIPKKRLDVKKDDFAVCLFEDCPEKIKNIFINTITKRIQIIFQVKR